MKTWKKIEPNSDFSIHNLPYGIFSTIRRSPRVGVAVGDEIIDLGALANIGLLDDIEVDNSVFHQNSLNEYIGLGKSVTNEIRQSLQKLLVDDNSPLRDHPSLFIKQANAERRIKLPVFI